MKPCTCGNHKGSTAIITTCFYITPDEKQIAFVRANAGKLVCFHCGGEVTRKMEPMPDHVTATTVTERLRELGVL